MAQLLKVEVEGMKEALERFSSNYVRKSLRSALDKGGTEGKKQMVGSITSNYNIKPKDAKAAVTVGRTRQNVLEISWKIKGAILSLYHYFHAKQDQQGIYVNVSRSETMHIPGAFIRTSRKGWTGVMKRVGAKAYPLTWKVNRGPSIPALIKGKIWETTGEKVIDFVQKEFKAQLQKRLTVRPK